MIQHVFTAFVFLAAAIAGQIFIDATSKNNKRDALSKMILFWIILGYAFVKIFGGL